MTEDEFIKMIHGSIKGLTSDGALGLCGYMWAVDFEDAVTVYALDVTPEQCTQMLCSEFLKKKPKMICLGIDRYCKEGQGTTLDSCVSFKLLNIEKNPIEGSCTFIIEYQSEGEHQVLEPDFDNTMWNSVINYEFTQVLADLISNQKSDQQ